MKQLFIPIAFCLSLATIVQSAALLDISLTHSAIGTFLFMGLKLSESVSSAIDVGGAIFVCLVSFQLSVDVFKNDKEKRVTILASMVAFWMTLLALTTFLNGGNFGARFSLFAYFARIGLPLAIVGFYAQKPRLVLFLKIVISITFITHGIEALTGHPEFIDYVFTGMNTLFGMQMSETQSLNLLRAVGIMDITTALLLLIRRSRKLVLWMAFWGLLTASLRIFGFGVQNWGELAIRISHFALPFALYYYWRHLSLLSSKQVS